MTNNSNKPLHAYYIWSACAVALAASVVIANHVVYTGLGHLQSTYESEDFHHENRVK